MTLTRHGVALDFMTSGHRGIEAGSAFLWIYRAWAFGDADLRVEPLPAKARVVEVGNGGLHSLGYLCDVACPGWEIIAIDPYVERGRFVDMLKTATTKLENVIDRVKIIRWPSPDAARLFDDESIDAILIDGDHDYGPVLPESRGVVAKVKKSGYMAGDNVDPDFPGCEKAWEEFHESAPYKGPVGKPDGNPWAQTIVVYGSTAIMRKSP